MVTRSNSRHPLSSLLIVIGKRHRAMPSSLRVAVVGGSMGGLTTALLLRALGHDVDVFERATGELTGFGAGIAAHEVGVRYFVERTTNSLANLTVPVHTYQLL